MSLLFLSTMRISSEIVLIYHRNNRKKNQARTEISKPIQIQFDSYCWNLIDDIRLIAVSSMNHLIIYWSELNNTWSNISILFCFHSPILLCHKGEPFLSVHGQCQCWLHRYLQWWKTWAKMGKGIICNIQTSAAPLTHWLLGDFSEILDT